MRVLVVEDELMIRMLLQDMLDDLGHTLAGEAGHIDEALTLARQADFDIAILDVNLGGQPISPVVEADRARTAVRVCDRLWPARRAGTVSHDPDLAEAIPGRRLGPGARSRRTRGPQLSVLNQTTRRAWSYMARRSYRAAAA